MIVVKNKEIEKTNKQLGEISTQEKYQKLANQYNV
jgi:hypothetical protein